MGFFARKAADSGVGIAARGRSGAWISVCESVRTCAEILGVVLRAAEGGRVRNGEEWSACCDDESLREMEVRAWRGAAMAEVRHVRRTSFACEWQGAGNAGRLHRRENVVDGHARFMHSM